MVIVPVRYTGRGLMKKHFSSVIATDACIINETRTTNSRTAPSLPAAPSKNGRWAQTEGLPLPLGVTWIEDEQAFNFAIYAEHAESVTLLLYSAHDFANPVLTFQFDS